MSDDYPRVCANCKWASCDDDWLRNFDRYRCHLNPPTIYEGGCEYPLVSGYDWCSGFSPAVNRSMNTKIRFPPCQEVPE